MEGFYCCVQLPSGKLYHRQRQFFSWNCAAKFRPASYHKVPVRYCENMMHHEADWSFNLFFPRVFEIFVHSKIEQKYLWIILSNFGVMPIFEVSPALSKSLYQAEDPSNQIIPWFYNRFALGQLRTPDDIFTKSDAWDKVTCVLLWVCSIFRTTLNLPGQCFQIIRSVTKSCIPSRIWTIPTGQVTSVTCATRYCKIIVA